MIQETILEARIIPNWEVRKESNRNPYIAWPNGWEHIDRAITQEIILPVRWKGVSLCIKVSI